MKAMIFAAGLGTRLQELTTAKPKALVYLNGKPLIQHCIEKLRNTGVSDIIINVFHYPELIIDFVRHNKNFGIHIEFSDESSELLDTGGGLMKAKHFFKGSESFFVCNTDVISDIDLNVMLTHHLASDSLATLAVRNRETSRYFLFDETQTLKGWENRKSSERIVHTADDTPLTPLAFSGIQLVNSDFFKLCKQEGKFSITKSWIELSKHNIIKGYLHDNDYWFDLGTPQALVTAEDYFNKRLSQS